MCGSSSRGAGDNSTAMNLAPWPKRARRSTFSLTERRHPYASDDAATSAVTIDHYLVEYGIGSSLACIGGAIGRSVSRSIRNSVRHGE
jgi:hypothetical protein